MKNCVISEVGRFGKHELWFSDKYDIWLFNYDNSLPDSYSDYPNIHVIKGKGLRFKLYTESINNGTFNIDDYDYILHTDNDIIMYPSDIEKIFKLTEYYKLDWASPSFRHIPNSEPWSNCVNFGTEKGIKYYSAVEQMTNCFSREAFKLVKDTFPILPDHTWGFEFLVSKLIDKGNNVGVLYDVIIEHAYDKGNLTEQPDWYYLNFPGRGHNDFVREMHEFIHLHNLEEYTKIKQYKRIYE